MSSGCGGFINISQNSKEVVFLGTFTSGGLKTEISNGELQVVEKGRYPKFVDSVGQVTFSGALAGREGRKVTYVTERCVFALKQDGLELTEVAPGVDMEKDILSKLPFEPIINDPKPMDKALFHHEPMGLRGGLSDIGIEERLSPTNRRPTQYSWITPGCE